MVIAPLLAPEGGGYIAYAPDLPGCMSDGATPEEAARNLQDAILEWCDEMERRGKEIPKPGSAIEKATNEARRVFALAEKQGRLLADQKRAYETLKNELDELKAIMALSSQNEIAFGSSFLRWTAVPLGTAIPAGVIPYFEHVREEGEKAH